MRKMLLKTCLIITIICLTICIISSYSHVEAAGSLDEVIQSGDSFINAGDDNSMIQESDLAELSKFISGVLLTIAVGVTILTGVVMGIKFVTQSIEDKAKIKESMLPWIIGIFISFGAFTIWEIAVNLFQNM